MPVEPRHDDLRLQLVLRRKAVGFQKEVGIANRLPVSSSLHQLR